MKRIGFLFVSMMCCIVSFAQALTGHLTFKGIPIDGTLKEFVSKLKVAGLSYVDESGGSALLEGEFAGYKGCQIYVRSFEDYDVVCGVGVFFPEMEDWSMLEKDYRTIKNLLTVKYGAPSECTEEFQGNGTPIDDSDRLFRLKMDKCTYEAVFDTMYGIIKLSLGHVNFRTRVILHYMDINAFFMERERLMEDL